MAKVFLCGIVVYQALYIGWFKLESDDMKVQKARMSAAGMINERSNAKLGEVQSLKSQLDKVDLDQ